MDKFGWIGQITGRGFDGAPKEVRVFKVVKDIRNHLVHFDPPCFSMAMEEAVALINAVRDVAVLVWRIREHLGTQLNTDLVKLILLPTIEYHPKIPFGRILPKLEEGIGYATCSTEHRGILARLGVD